MYNSFQLALRYLDYYRRASNSNGHGMHSPFVFDFIRYVLNNENQEQPPKELEALRNSLFNDKRKLEIEDLGAGSVAGSSIVRTVGGIARTALKPRKYAQLLFRLAKHFKPDMVIELGTSLGLTTAYLSKARPEAEIFTIEGSTAILDVAHENLLQLNCQNVKTQQGHFDEMLPFILQQVSTVDLAYVDGNHRYQPTINYFNQLLRHSHAGTVMVFDDIHWSPEMERAWEEIRQHEDVTYSIDIFFLGFIFFRKEFKVKQHFMIRF